MSIDSNLKLSTADPLYPHLHLLVSGGNTQLIYLRSWVDWEIIGQTKDDAAGECFDKVGRMLGLPYPGGVWLSRIAGLIDTNLCRFPVGMRNSGDFNFSFSGMKTAVRYYLEKQIVDDSGSKFILEQPLSEPELELLTGNPGSLQNGVVQPTLDQRLTVIQQVCISAQSAIVEALVHKVKLASRELEWSTVGLSGGVSANQLLRHKLQQLFGSKLRLAPKQLTGDNAVMIGLAGLLDKRYLNK